MKNILRLILCISVGLGLAGCSFLQKGRLAPAKMQVGAGAPLPSYAGPKARIAVADFEVKATKATGEIGAGLRETLVALLANSNRFSIVERRQAPSAAVQEQAPADVIITAAITEFEPQTSGGRGGMGGGGGSGSGILGGLLGNTLNKAHLVLDIRIVNASTSEVLAATRVQGQASDISGSVMGNWALKGGVSAYSDTPMEKAIRICIIEAVRYISQTITPAYYKY